MTTPDFLFENQLISRDEKINFLKNHPNQKIILDITSLDRNDFIQHNQIYALVSTKLNLGAKAEVHILKDHQEVNIFLSSQGIDTIESHLGDGFFHLPRILSTIVNEAYYALEDKVANKEDIDRAMKFGVNYPSGPFEWSKGREKFIVELLDNLFHKTKSDRYKVCNLLRQESLGH